MANKNELHLTENSLIKIANDLEIGQINSATPLIELDVLLDEKDIDLLQIDKKRAGLNSFYTWKLSGKSVDYLLVGTRVEFFEKKAVNNPFQENDDFDVFAEKIKSHFEITSGQLYTSDDGFYLTTDTLSSEKFSFFLYKL